MGWSVSRHPVRTNSFTSANGFRDALSRAHLRVTPRLRTPLGHAAQAPTSLIGAWAPVQATGGSSLRPEFVHRLGIQVVVGEWVKPERILDGALQAVMVVVVGRDEGAWAHPAGQPAVGHSPR